MAEQYDAIIIGAGIIGAATGFELAKRGYKTLNLDRHPAAGYGSTGNSCAIIRVHYSTLDGTALAYESYFYWRDWATYLDCTDERGPAQFIECGCLMMQTKTNDYLARHIALSEELGIPFEVWDQTRIRDKLPIYHLARFGPPRTQSDADFGEPSGGQVENAIFWPTAGYISDPQLATHNLQRSAEAKGGQFRFNASVVEVLRENGRTAGVRLADGTALRSPVVVNVAGPHSAKVNAMASVLDDMRITTRALKQEVVHLPAPADFDFLNLGTVVSDSDIGCYCRPETGNHILVGSEDPPCDTLEFVDPDDWDTNFTRQGQTQAYRYGQRVPELGIPESLQGAVDLYDASDDWIPIYDKSNLPGYYMAIGSSGNQFKNAPVAGKLMATLVEYCEGGNEHDEAPLQFELPKIGRSVNAGFYSRKREINKDSSFSVLG